MIYKILGTLAVILIAGYGLAAYVNPERFKDAPNDTGVPSTANSSTVVSTSSTQGAVAALQQMPQGTQQAASHGKISINWKFTSAGEKDGIPYTKVTAVLSFKEYDAGTYAGTCSEIGANNQNGIDGKGLLPGELSGVQCWYAGGGDEVGLFAHEDGGFDLLAGQLGEGEEGSPFFRGNFKTITTIR